MTGGDPELHLEGVPWSSGSALTRAGSLTPQWMQSKTPGASKSDRGLHRASKRAPEERETWKHKERWAAGPDSSRNWTEVPVSGREREGWTSEDALCRSENRRTKDAKARSFEGGYVQKQSKWNDEERSDRWSSALKSRNEASRKRTSPGPRASTHRRNAKTVSPKSASNGRFHSKTRFSREELLRIQRRLLERTGPVLQCPEGVDVSYPEFLATRKEDLSQQEEVKSSEEQDKIAGVSSMELEADSWVYKDPSGVVRGPYAKEEVLDWWQEGYFTPELQIQSQVSSKENWMPLKQLLTAWGLPSERVKNPVPLSYPSIESETMERTLEHVGSLPTVGSHIPVSVLMEAGLDRTNIDQEDSHQKQNFFQNVPVLAEPQIPFQNPVPDFQQTIQDLMIQQQRQNQVPAFNLPANPGTQFLQNSALLGTGFNGQNLQESALLTPGVLEALQQRLQQQQDLARSPLQNTGLNFGTPGVGLNTGQFTGNANLASLFRQGMPQTQPTAQQLLQQQNLMSCDSQRLLENRTGIYRAPSGHYPNLETLLQRPQNHLMNLSYPDPLSNSLSRQSPTGGAIRENLLSLGGLQNTGSSIPNGVLQQTRQRSNVSPVNANQSFQQEQDLNHLLRQSSANQNYPVKQQSASFALQDFPVSSSEDLEPKGSSPVVPESHQNRSRGPLSNAWGVSAPSVHPASLLEIQEQEIKGSGASSQQQNPIKPQDSNPASGVSWNVPRVKPPSLMDIMQEDAASKKQTQGTVVHQQGSTGSKKGPVWSKRPVEAQTLKQDSRKATENGVCLFSGQITISEDFSKWCERSLIELGGTGDLTLIEFLMSLNSRSEIAEYIQEYFPSAPIAKRSTFISEFLKRKEAHENKTQEKTKSSFLAKTGSGSKQTTTSRVKESKPKGKKTAKGQHLPPDMLGFRSNANLDSCYRSGSIG